MHPGQPGKKDRQQENPPQPPLTGHKNIRRGGRCSNSRHLATGCNSASGGVQARPEMRVGRWHAHGLVDAFFLSPGSRDREKCGAISARSAASDSSDRAAGHPGERGGSGRLPGWLSRRGHLAVAVGRLTIRALLRLRISPPTNSEIDPALVSLPARRRKFFPCDSVNLSTCRLSNNGACAAHRIAVPILICSPLCEMRTAYWVESLGSGSTPKSNGAPIPVRLNCAINAGICSLDDSASMAANVCSSGLTPRLSSRGSSMKLAYRSASLRASEPAADSALCGVAGRRGRTPREIVDDAVQLVLGAIRDLGEGYVSSLVGRYLKLIQPLAVEIPVQVVLRADC